MQKELQQINDLAQNHYLQAFPISATQQFAELTTIKQREALRKFVAIKLDELHKRANWLQNLDTTDSVQKEIAVRHDLYASLKRDWISPGRRLQALQVEIDHAARINKDYFLQVISPSATGVIVQKRSHFIYQKVDEIRIAKMIADDLPQHIRDQVQRVWGETQERYLSQVEELLENALSGSVTTAIQRTDTDIVYSQSARDIQVERDTWQIVKTVHYDVAVASSLAYFAVPWASPVVAALTAFLSVLGADKRSLHMAQRELVQAVTDQLAIEYTQLTLPEPEAMRESRVDRFFNDVKRDYLTDIQAYIRQKLNQLVHEANLLQEIVKDRTETLEQVARAIHQWETYIDDNLNEVFDV